MNFLLILAVLFGVSAPVETVAITHEEKEEIIEEKVIIEPLNVNELISQEFGTSSVMHRIAQCESGKRQFQANGEVLRGRVNNKDVGIFQINEYYHLLESKNLGFDINTTEGNIGYAKHLFETNGTRPWIWSEPCWG